MKGGSDQQQLNLPAGFRFHPTDEELVVHYLCRRCAGQQVPAPVIAEIDLYKFNPWELPGMSFYGEKEWYFFSHRDRKYPNGSRPNRAAGTGYWKATGADKPVGKPKTLAIKKALVFYAGKAPRGVKTNWIMHEYRLANVDRSAGKINNLRLDDWVLCRLYNKKGAMEKHYIDDHEAANFSDSEEQKPIVNLSSTFAGGMLSAEARMFDSSESVPKMYTDSSNSDHALSPDFKEVQSEAKWIDFPCASDFQRNFDNTGDPFGPELQYGYQMSLFQEMFGYTQKPF